MEDFEVSGVLTLKCCLSLNPRGQSEKHTKSSWDLKVFAL